MARTRGELIRSPRAGLPRQVCRELKAKETEMRKAKKIAAVKAKETEMKERKAKIKAKEAKRDEKKKEEYQQKLIKAKAEKEAPLEITGFIGFIGFIPKSLRIHNHFIKYTHIIILVQKHI
jgi:hypothetical protein